MASFERYGSQSYAPSAPTLPEDYNYTSTTTTTSTPPPNSHGHDHTQFHSHGSAPPPNSQGHDHTQFHSHGSAPPPNSHGHDHTQFHSHGSSPSSYAYGQSSSSSHGYGQSSSSPYGYGQMGSSSSFSSSYGCGYVGFPAGTSPDVIRSFEMVDRDRSGFIDDNELRQALSSGYQKFNLRTIRLLISLFKNPNDPAPRIGPKEFAGLWNCLGQWRGIFQRYDKDRSGRIDVMELRDALYGLGYMVPGSVLQLLISKYDNGSGRKVELDFDSFVECGMIVKGLTEKFKEKDPRYSGSATFTYDAFMSMVIPFLVSY